MLLTNSFRFSQLQNQIKSNVSKAMPRGRGREQLTSGQQRGRWLIGILSPHKEKADGDGG